ncbi:MAG TPA: NADH-quinone oxidoreductase subunit C [Solirubrobacterales bacterium]|nr:NADH-quinone oxidoreductase subunit C [Solirubrobacterales bacterium]
MPDAPGLELIRGEIEQNHPGAVLDTSFDRGQAALVVDPEQVLGVLGWLRDAPGQGYRFLSSLHVADYLPAEPRFGVHYELLNRDRVERVRVKALLRDPGALAAGPVTGEGPAGGAAAPFSAPPPRHPRSSVEGAADDPLPVIDSCVELFPTAEFQEREAYDFFGIVFRGHPDLTRILLPDDYVGWPQRRDFPVGGEPVLFTYNEHDRG